MQGRTGECEEATLIIKEFHLVDRRPSAAEQQTLILITGADPMHPRQIIQGGARDEVDRQSHHLTLRAASNTDRPKLIKVLDAALLQGFASDGRIQRLSRIDSTGRNLHPGVGMVDMIENQKLIITIRAEHIHSHPEPFGNP